MREPPMENAEIFYSEHVSRPANASSSTKIDFNDSLIILNLVDAFPTWRKTCPWCKTVTLLPS